MFYPVLKCVDPEGFAGAVKKFTCEEFEWFYFSSEAIEAPFFETTPIGEYEPPKNFPECCNFHRGVLDQSISLMEKFPNCCKSHKSLLKAKWFNKRDYNGIARKILTTLSHTEYHIFNRIDAVDWYKDITDYIDYCVSSFGRLPDGFGAPIGLATYLDNLKYAIKIRKEFPKDKKTKLISYIDAYEKEGAEEAPDFTILLETYSKWLQTFPFEMGIFTHLKEKYKKTLPFLKTRPVYNPYLGVASAKLKTRTELIASLVDLTDNILLEINGLVLHEKGLLNDPAKHNLEVVFGHRRLELKTLKEKAIDERVQYVQLLKDWFSGEERFLNSLRSLIAPTLASVSAEPPPQTKAEKLETDLRKYGFFELPKVKVLTDSQKRALIEGVSQQSLPYIVAMLNYLDFFSHLNKQHFPIKKEMYQEASRWFNSDKDGRTIKGNIGSLLKTSTEDKSRYTAHTYKETVEKDYQNLK